MRHDFLRHRFVEFIPEALEEGVLYVSVEYTTVTHLCCCGCGHEVSTTLSPTDWRLIYDGKTVSLEPSIGSWSLPCQSHYFVTRSRIVWERRWSNSEIDSGRRYNTLRKSQHCSTSTSEVEPQLAAPNLPEKIEVKNRESRDWLKRLWPF